MVPIIKSFNHKILLNGNLLFNERKILPTITLAFRWSSNLPEPSKPLEERPAIYRLPIVPRDPVPQTKLTRIPVEYHGVQAIQFKDEETIWYPVYRFPYINHCKYVIRTKVFITFCSLVTCITQIGLFLKNPQIELLGVALLSSVTLGAMLFIGNFSRKLICQIYTSDDGEFVRLCRFTFFGKRLDMVLPATSVVQLTENNITFKKSFLKLKTKKPENISLEHDTYEFYDEEFNICLIFGGVSDLKRFETVLGRLLSRRWVM